MAFSGIYPASYYGGYGPQIGAAPAPVQAPNPQNNTGIIWVQGEAGAKSYLVAPNTTVQLWDSEAQVIYLKSADASGMPSFKVLDYTIRDNTPKAPAISPESDFATKDDINMLQEELNGFRAKLEAFSTASKRPTKKEAVKDEQ